MAPNPKDIWESRYGAQEYIYGTEPNGFLVEAVGGGATTEPPKTALCLADGEGRNGVYLASLGYDVTSMDMTQAGMDKASRLATQAGVNLATEVANLADYDLGENKWDLIVSIFAHTPPEVRKRVHASIAAALTPGGRFVLEAYTPDQIGRGTGGPPVPELTMTLDGLSNELSGMEFTTGQELVRPVVEGAGHTGDGAVVQVIAVHP